MADVKVLKDLELVEVEYSNNDKKATFTFLDENAGQIHEVNFNRQNYSDGKWFDDPEKAAKVDEWCHQFFGTEFGMLKECVGQKHDVYSYPNFASLWECEMIEKFTKAQNGQIFETTIKAVTVDDYFIKISYEVGGKTYQSKQTFGKYMESMKKWFKDPVKQAKQFERFQEKYGVPVEEAQSIVGKKIFVEVKCAFGSNYYGDIKAFPKK